MKRGVLSVMPEINSFYNAIVFGTLLSAADKIGLKPMLLGRQASRILKPLIRDLAKLTIGKDLPSNIEELIEDLKIIVKNGGISDLEKLEMKFSENCLIVKSTDCMYIDMAEYGKSIGYGACPLCVLGIVVMSLIEALGFGYVADFKAETNGKNCVYKMIID